MYFGTRLGLSHRPLDCLSERRRSKCCKGATDGLVAVFTALRSQCLLLLHCVESLNLIRLLDLVLKSLSYDLRRECLLLLAKAFVTLDVCQQLAFSAFQVADMHPFVSSHQVAPLRYQVVVVETIRVARLDMELSHANASQ